MLTKIQTAPIPDHVTDDGVTLSKLPYPVVCNDDGAVTGSPLIARVVGFVSDLAVMAIETRWTRRPAGFNPVGQYLIVADHEGALSTLATAVSSCEELGEEPLTREELERHLADFAAEVSLDLERGLSGYGPGAVRIAQKIARRAGL